jgi:acetoin utilization deacetylase AcuC-like enzyme
MRIYYSDPYDFPLTPGHRFPLQKYARLRDRIQRDELVPASDLILAEPANDTQLQRAHDQNYLDRVLQGLLSEGEIRRLGLPWSPQLVERARRSVGGSIGACVSALMESLSINLGGGTHHAHPDHGAGFCLFNDVAVAIRDLQTTGRAERFIVLDCDVHQGDGTAVIFADDDAVFTFSIHGQQNYPFHKPPSDRDIGLPKGTSDSAYLEALQMGLDDLLVEGRWDLGIYLAGADPLEGDRFGSLSLTADGLLKRDRFVLEQCQLAKIPVAIVLSGGYGRDINDTVEAHFQTAQLAVELSERG